MNMVHYNFTFEDTGAKFGRCPLVKVNPSGYVLPVTFKKHLNTMINFEVRPDDVWLLGLPKSGTTWTRELIWCVHHEGDLTEARKKYITERFMFLEQNPGVEIPLYGRSDEEIKAFRAKDNHLLTDGYENLKKAESPRFITSHVPLSLLPPTLLDTCKVVYVTRNFKDTIVSFYKMQEGGEMHLAESIKNVVEQYIEDKGFYSPLPEHVKEAWKLKDHKNMLFLTFEEMKKDITGVVQRLANFLDKNLTGKQLDLILNHVSFDSMKANKYTNMEHIRDIDWLPENKPHIRKGIVGDWKNYFSPELLEKYNDWWKTHMGDCDFEFEED